MARVIIFGVFFGDRGRTFLLGLVLLVLNADSVVVALPSFPWYVVKTADDNALGMS